MDETTAANSSPTWHRPGRVRDIASVLVSSSPRQTRWHIRVHDQATSNDTGHPRTVHIPELSAVSPHTFSEHSLSGNSLVPRHVRAHIAESSFPCPVPIHVTTSIKPNPLMSLFDPASVRQAVAAFTPRRPQKFQDLSSAKEVIVELRQKRASYRAIADLLTQHCLPISKTAVAAYCHEILGEIVRPRRRPIRKRSGSVPDIDPCGRGEVTATAGAESIPPESGDVAVPPRPRGPRIAQVRMLNPQIP